jgi:hypothetical protein
MPAEASTTTPIDLQEAERFLTALAEGEPVTFQTFSDRENGPALARILHGTLQQCASTLAAMNRQRAGVYVMVNAGDLKGRRRENVTGIRALFVDLDGAPLEPVRTAAVTPHVIVESSPGKWHAYWMVSGCELRDFERYQRALAARFNGDPKVCDLPRVMRVPGFAHCKGEPFRSRIIELHEIQPYPIDQVVTALGLSAAAQTQTPPPAAPGQPQRGEQHLDGGALPVFAQGGRNAQLARLAGRLRRQGLHAEAIEASLQVVNRRQCRPPLDTAEVARIAASIGRYPAGTIDAGSAPAPQPWPDPLLPGTVRVPEIPAELLPTWAGKMAAAVAASTQTPAALSTMLMLPVMAACLQRRFEVQPYGADGDYREPLSIWIACVLGSGNRKTAVHKALSDPLVAWEKRERDRLRRQIDTNYAQREVVLKRIESLKLQAGKEDDPKRRERLRDEIAEQREVMPVEMFSPRLFTSDSTPERLQGLLVEQDEAMTVLSDEGTGILGTMAGGYNGGGGANLDVYLQGHAGAAIRVDRAGRMAHIDRPAVTFGLALQPGVLQDQGKNKRFRDSGLMARFLYAVPMSNVGSRDVRARVPIPDAIRHAYAEGLRTLLDGMNRPIGAPKMLPFAADARECWLDLCERIERQQGEGGRLAHMVDWTAKLAGAAARIAGVLALAEYGTGIDIVPLASTQRAVRLAELLVPHAEAAFALMGASDSEGDAVAVLSYLRRHRMESIGRRELQKAMEGRFRSLDRLLVAIKLLQDWHVLGREHRTQGVGRPSNFYEVNPKCFVDNSHSSQ